MRSSTKVICVYKFLVLFVRSSLLKQRLMFENQFLYDTLIYTHCTFAYLFAILELEAGFILLSIGDTNT
jgi:uncharacterized membrane protein (DUF485 family)